MTEVILRQSINESLQLHLYSNAIFLSERLYAESRTLENLHTLVNCHFQSGQYRNAYNILHSLSKEWKNTTNDISSNLIFYLFAVCCCKLQKFKEAEFYLEHLLQNQYPNEAAVNYWMGIVCRYSNSRKEKAIEYFKRALAYNPMLWTAFEQLCQLGATVKASEVYDQSKAAVLLQNVTTAPVQPSCAASAPPTSCNFILQTPATKITPSTPLNIINTNIATPAVTKFHQISDLTSTPFTPAGALNLNTSAFTPLTKYVDHSLLFRGLTHFDYASNADLSGITPKNHFLMQPRNSLGFTPAVTPTPVKSINKPRMPQFTPTPTSSEHFTLATSTSLEFHTPSPQVASNGTPATVNPAVVMNPPKVPPKITKAKVRAGQRTQGKKVTQKLFGSVEKSAVKSSRSSLSSISSPNFFQQTPSADDRIAPPVIRDQDSDSMLSDAHYLFSLLCALGEAYKLLCQYRCKEAVHRFLSLPENHSQTGWVLCNIGKCYFEMSDYKRAEAEFEKVMRLEPYRLEGLEIYSTVLWHVKKDKALSYLAQRMAAVDKLSPYTLCTIGNCFSLQKDHETALKFFERATKINGLFPYAYTLAGHEHFANDELDTAMQCFRKAIEHDPRHYNAWYGIGIAHRKQERFDHAEYDFKRAIEINPQSSALHCYLGMTLADRKKFEDAVKSFDRAILLNSQNLMARFKKANTLFSMMEYQDDVQKEEAAKTAIFELEMLREAVPKESSVYFLLGKIFKKLGMQEKALHNFQIAMNLQNPTRDDPLIKEEIAKLMSEEDDQEDLEQQDEDELDQEGEEVL